MTAEFVFENREFLCKGAWTVLGLSALDMENQTHDFKKAQSIPISGKSLSSLDSAGALKILNIRNTLAKEGYKTELVYFSKVQMELLTLIESKREAIDYTIPERPKQGFFYQLGEEVIKKEKQLRGLLKLVQTLGATFVQALSHVRRFQVPSIISNIDSAGVQALPIVGLLSFLIGVVLAYQMGLQLQTYGANIFIAYLSGMAIFREFAPLITAIIVAGRTSSAFTAQIGSMKLNEEIDAILTMGLSPIELLVMPKVIGLILVFPLLIFWSNFFGILGAMIMSKWMLGINPADFLYNLKESVGLKQMLLGLYKAPVFALLIALVGCFQGFRVGASADSIGSQTTKSVVQALFLIIIADAVFSVFYSWMGL
jgi:phospholipid/cholesterol/gamma-HCH transport system permease protein